MPTQPRSSADHYAAAERLLDAAPEEPGGALLAAICHALLAQAPRRARKRRDASGRAGRHTNGGLPPHLTWGAENE
jgi:hypothetical protein